MDDTTIIVSKCANASVKDNVNAIKTVNTAVAIIASRLPSYSIITKAVNAIGIR